MDTPTSTNPFQPKTAVTNEATLAQKHHKRNMRAAFYLFLIILVGIAAWGALASLRDTSVVGDTSIEQSQMYNRPQASNTMNDASVTAAIDSALSASSDADLKTIDAEFK